MRDALQVHDTYIAKGQHVFGFVRPELTMWEGKLASLLPSNGTTGNINIQAALNEHLATYG